MISIRCGLLLAAFSLFLGGARAADDMVTESRPIDARVVRVKLDGVIDLKLRRGDTPALSITADKRYISKITSVQTGDSLQLDMEAHGFKFNRGMVRAELVLPGLRELVSEGVGATEVSGFSGDEIQLTLDGAGSMKVSSDYRHIRATLGGVGSMHLWASENDSVELDLQGAGYITLGGRSKMLKATLGGLGGLNAQQFQAESVNLDLSGLGNATVHARQNATLNLSGLGSVTVYGKPQNRNVSVDGLGKVSWK
ncbi:GIN domain-containing protein [Pseudoduganella namucuonensis]